MTDGSRAQPDLIRHLGFESVYRLPQFDDGSPTAVPPMDAGEAMKAFTPEQRDRVFNVAARRLAFQLLFLLDAQSVKDAPSVVRAELEQVDELGPMGAEKIAATVMGAFTARSQADADFASIAPQWPAHRQAGVDRAILRLAHYELTTGATPARIAINEAVELARYYSTDKSPAFVNGLLDKIAQRTQPAGGVPGPGTTPGSA